MANKDPSPSTRFKPGVSGNPRGPRKEVGEVKELARAHSAEAIERLLHWMRKGDGRVSVAAAQALLDRGHGKPPQQVAVDATFRPCDVSAEPLTPEAWAAMYGPNAKS